MLCLLGLTSSIVRQTLQHYREHTPHMGVCPYAPRKYGVNGA